MNDPSAFAALQANASHGTRARYKSGCRCDSCTDANRDAQRARRARRAAERRSGVHARPPVAIPASQRDGSRGARTVDLAPRPHVDSGVEEPPAGLLDYYNATAANWATLSPTERAEWTADWYDGPDDGYEDPDDGYEDPDDGYEDEEPAAGSAPSPSLAQLLAAMHPSPPAPPVAPTGPAPGSVVTMSGHAALPAVRCAQCGQPTAAGLACAWCQHRPVPGRTR